MCVLLYVGVLTIECFGNKAYLYLPSVFIFTMCTCIYCVLTTATGENSIVVVVVVVIIIIIINSNSLVGIT